MRSSGGTSRNVRPAASTVAPGQVQLAVLGLVGAERKHVRVVELGHGRDATGPPGTRRPRRDERGERPAPPRPPRPLNRRVLRLELATALAPPAVAWDHAWLDPRNLRPPRRGPRLSPARPPTSATCARRPGRTSRSSARRGARPTVGDRHAPRPPRARGDRRVHRRGPRPARPPRADGAQPGPAAPAAGHRPGALRRRGGRGRRRRDEGRRGGRRRARRGRLRPAARGHDPRRRSPRAPSCSSRAGRTSPPGCAPPRRTRWRTPTSWCGPGW